MYKLIYGKLPVFVLFRMDIITAGGRALLHIEQLVIKPIPLTIVGVPTKDSYALYSHCLSVLLYERNSRKKVENFLFLATPQKGEML